MKNKKIIIIFTTCLIVLLIGGYFGIKYVKNKQEETVVEEYVPEEEITEEQYRQTIVSLYFVNKETKEIEPEARLVDITELINNPYEKLITLLMETPKNDKLEKVIPEDTSLLKTMLQEDCLIIDFSKEFLNYSKEDESYKTNLIQSIVNTVTELTEVNQVKFLIEGQESEDFNEVYKR